jgi:hypothetical protein
MDPAIHRGRVLHLIAFYTWDAPWRFSQSLVAQAECLRRDVVRKATTLAADVHNKQGRKLETSTRAHCFERASTTERLIAMQSTGWDKEQ